MSWSDTQLEVRIHEIISTSCSTRPLTAVEDGRARLGLRATVKSTTGTWTVALVGLTVDAVSHPEVAMTVAACRRWLGDGRE